MVLMNDWSGNERDLPGEGLTAPGKTLERDHLHILNSRMLITETTGYDWKGWKWSVACGFQCLYQSIFDQLVEPEIAA